MRIIFMGTPEFAVPSLDMLVREGHDIAAVVTQPDKPKGRGNKLTPPAVKVYACEHGIKVLQPEKVRTAEFIGCIRELEPELLVTAAYGKILPKDVLDIPQKGCINVHGSLLPKYRGAAPIQWAVINGEKKTGITTMFTDVGMDTGDMLLKGEIEITDDMTAGELHDKLSCLGAEVLLKTIRELENGTLSREKQCDAEASYASMMKKDTGLIDWSKNSSDIHDLVRGTNPWPGAYTFYQGEKMRIWKTGILGRNPGKKPGTILSVGKDGIVAASGDGLVKILEIQFESCRKMCVEDYICGHRIDEGEILGQ